MYIYRYIIIKNIYRNKSNNKAKYEKTHETGGTEKGKQNENIINKTYIYIYIYIYTTNINKTKS